MERVRRHAAHRPEPPNETGDAAKDDAAADRWWDMHERWMARHPAGREWASYGTYFTIHTLAVIP